MKKSLKITLIVLGVFLGIIIIDTLQALLFDNSPINRIRENLDGGNTDNIEECLNSVLDGYIAIEVDDIKEVKLSNIINIDLTNVGYSFIGESTNGIYAILKTNDDNIIEELDNYFNEQYNGYQTVDYNNYKIYVYNNIYDFDLNDDLIKCFE